MTIVAITLAVLACVVVVIALVQKVELDDRKRLIDVLEDELEQVTDELEQERNPEGRDFESQMIGDAIIGAIVEGNMTRIECVEDDDGDRNHVTIWSAGAGEQIGELAKRLCRGEN